MRKPGPNEKQCPKCGEICNKHARSCGDCGHVFQEGNGNDRSAAKTDMRCQATAENGRCCFPGTSTRDRADDKGVYSGLNCRWHADSTSGHYRASIVEISKQWEAGTLVDTVIYSEGGIPMPVYPRDHEKADRAVQSAADAYCAERNLGTREQCMASLRKMTGATTAAGAAEEISKREPLSTICLRNSREAIRRHEAREMILPPWVLEHHQKRVASATPVKETA